MKETKRSPKTGSKRLIAVGCIVLAVILIAASAVFVSDLLQYNTGVVTSIKATSKNNGEIGLKITYFLPSGGYSVRKVFENEGEYVGDGIADYDGSLGKYRIMIQFGDAEPHDALAKKLSANGVFELTDEPVLLKAKIAHPSDHGFVLYLGSDTPIHVEAVEDGNLNGLGGIIIIPIIVGDTESPV